MRYTKSSAWDNAISLKITVKCLNHLSFARLAAIIVKILLGSRVANRCLHKWCRGARYVWTLNFDPTALRAKIAIKIWYPPDPGRNRPRTDDVQGKMTVQTLPRTHRGEGSQGQK